MSEPIALIGQTNFRNQKKRFGIKQKDRLSHMLLVGKTGSGKSTVLSQMMLSDLKNGTGFVLLDAHGDLADQILSHVPEERIKDVVYINPVREGFSPAINLLDNGQKHLAVSQFLSIFHHLWPEFWGPRTEYLLRNTLLLLAETVPGASLADVPPVLTDIVFRDRLVRLLTVGPLRTFWQQEFEQYSRNFRNEAIAPILNKVGSILLNPVIRPMVSARKNQLNFRKILDEGQILIANLAKGTLGEDASSLLGSILLSKLTLAGLSRSDLAEGKRNFFPVYADEAQQFTTESTVGLFAELRKFGVGATWATQYLSSLPESIRDAILGNAGSLLVFTVSAEDAEFLTKELAPRVRPKDLLILPAFNFYLKLRIDGVISAPFSAETIRQDPAKSTRFQKLRRFSPEDLSPRHSRSIPENHKLF